MAAVKQKICGKVLAITVFPVSESLWQHHLPLLQSYGHLLSVLYIGVSLCYSRV
jgi:hypothetical protein